jgi:hypothetical protein
MPDRLRLAIVIMAISSLYLRTYRKGHKASTSDVRGRSEPQREEEQLDTMAEFRPPWTWRLGRRFFPMPKPFSFTRMEEYPWATDCITVNTTLAVSWRDRLRVLISGRFHQRHLIYCETMPGRLETIATSWVEMPKVMDLE